MNAYARYIHKYLNERERERERERVYPYISQGNILCKM